MMVNGSGLAGQRRQTQQEWQSGMAVVPRKWRKGDVHSSRRTSAGRYPKYRTNSYLDFNLYYLPVQKMAVEVKVSVSMGLRIYVYYIHIYFYIYVICLIEHIQGLLYMFFRGMLPTATPFLPRDASRRFQSRSGYLRRKHPNKQPMFPRTLSLVVYEGISSRTRAINFLTICHRFYERVPPNSRSAQASPWSAPNQSQRLCRAMGITYPSMESTRHLTTSWKPWKIPLFIQSILFSPIR